MWRSHPSHLLSIYPYSCCYSAAQSCLARHGGSSVHGIFTHIWTPWNTGETLKILGNIPMRLTGNIHWCLGCNDWTCFCQLFTSRSDACHSEPGSYSSSMNFLYVSLPVCYLRWSCSQPSVRKSLDIIYFFFMLLKKKKLCSKTIVPV